MPFSKSPDDTLQLVTSFDVKVGGKSLAKDIVVMKILVKSEVNKIAKAYLFIEAGKSYENLFPESEDPNFAPGKTIEISLGFAEKNVKVFSELLQNIA